MSIRHPKQRAPRDGPPPSPTRAFPLEIYIYYGYNEGHKHVQEACSQFHSALWLKLSWGVLQNTSCPTAKRLLHKALPRVQNWGYQTKYHSVVEAGTKTRRQNYGTESRGLSQRSLTGWRPLRFPISLKRGATLGIPTQPPHTTIMDDLIDEILAEMPDPVPEEHQFIDLDSQVPDPRSSYQLTSHGSAPPQSSLRGGSK